MCPWLLPWTHPHHRHVGLDPFSQHPWVEQSMMGRPIQLQIICVSASGWTRNPEEHFEESSLLIRRLTEGSPSVIRISSMLLLTHVEIFWSKSPYNLWELETSTWAAPETRKKKTRYQKSQTRNQRPKTTTRNKAPLKSKPDTSGQKPGSIKQGTRYKNTRDQKPGTIGQKWGTGA